MYWGNFSFRPYVSVAQRRENAQKHAQKLNQNGRRLAPVHINGRAITHTFWGNAWCAHLEKYSDFANRLVRGRSYVRNGSVFDLQINPGRIDALVSGSDIYTISVTIQKLQDKHWQAVKNQCSGRIGSAIELLQGKFDRQVMEIITSRDTGLFPAPLEITMKCSCPDFAGMCKHKAAVLYGVGARLDTQPELLFLLRQVDHLELIETAATLATQNIGAGGNQTLAEYELSEVFGIEIETQDPQPIATPQEEAKPAQQTVTKKTRTKTPKNHAKPRQKAHKTQSATRPAKKRSNPIT